MDKIIYLDIIIYNNDYHIYYTIGTSRDHHMIEFNVHTNSRVEMLDITEEVRSEIRKSKVSSGICIVFVPHTTAGVTINENADADVQTDMIKAINTLVPFEGGYRHMEGNSAAHLKSTLFSPELTVIIENGRPVLGTWQGIYFCEFDGPRSRKVYLKVIEG
jgi:secondary thiamine-phosphate synthase enzyme